MAKRIRLTSSVPDHLPLAWDMGDMLRGEKDPMRDQDTGKRLAGRALDNQLDLFGQDLKTVTFSGSFVPAGGDPRKLEPWSVTVQVPGRLDASTLGYMAHAAAREAAYGAQASGKARKGTPPQVYTTEIVIGQEPPAPRRRRYKPRPVVRQYVTHTTGKARRAIYRDRATGRFAPKSSWERSP